MSKFEHLIRFVNQHDQIVYGDLPELVRVEELLGCEVQSLTGDPVNGLVEASGRSIVKKLLCPVANCPAIYCIGANSRSHTEEAKFTPPSQPVVFQKSPDCLAGPLDGISCPSPAQSQLDYEGELCFVFAKDCKDVTESDAFSCVLGYTIGNDLTARDLLSMAVSGFQMGYAKSFDQFAPVGPYLVASHLVEDPDALRLVTRVNGEVRQNMMTNDMIWKVPQLIVHLTRGHTIRAGTLVMTGTPEGVGWFMQPPTFLKDGDEVTVSIDKLGTLENRMVFE